jgi:two-component system, OmpR family, sensor histidine kinase KdpD
MKRGQLRIYLGPAPGVGKTYAMLDEGHRRRDRGTDVVVGFVETYGRKLTARLAEGLETIPRRVVTYRGARFEEMDIDALLARHPAVALVDELAHTNVPGSRNAKRWQDVEELLDAGITVITTVNIQHLDCLHDVVEKITGVPQRETIPDAVVRAAHQIELVDMAPEALRRRMAHGNVYPREKVDAALSNYFRVGNLTALRELALLWVADQVEEGLLKYRADHGIEQTWEARERVVVALTGGPEGDTLIRRAARIAARTVGGDLLAVHVARSDGLAGVSPAALAAQRRLVESLGGTYHQVIGDDVPEALLDFARAENATQLVLGASRRSWLATILTGPGIGARTIHGSGDIDVHIITHAQMGRRRGLLPRPRGGLSQRRKIYGFALTAVLAPLLTFALMGATAAGSTSSATRSRSWSASRGPARTWTIAAFAGQGTPPARPEDADVDVDVGDEYCLALRGRDLPAEDRRVLLTRGHAPGGDRQHARRPDGNTGHRPRPRSAQSRPRPDVRPGGGLTMTVSLPAVTVTESRKAPAPP